MKPLATRLLALSSALLLTGCVVTAPIKVASTGAKVATKTAKVGAKAAIKTGQALTPDSDDEDDTKK